jgi:hypothetical protein
MSPWSHPERVDVNGTELRHVAHGRRANAERRLTVDNDESAHMVTE